MGFTTPGSLALLQGEFTETSKQSLQKCGLSTPGLALWDLRSASGRSRARMAPARGYQHWLLGSVGEIPGC